MAVRTPPAELGDQTVADGCWSLPNGRVVMLPRVERRVLRELWVADTQAVPREKLLAAMVGDDEDGGALSVESHLSQTLRKLRVRVEPLGYLIVSQRGEGVRLVRAPQVDGAYGMGDGQQVMK